MALPLTGLPITVKDTVDVAGWPSTHGTPARANNIADQDVPAVKRLRGAGAFILGKTAWGRHVYAVGGNEASALLMGLRVAATKVGVYVISGFCAALAGLLFSLYILSGNSLHAIGMELDAIAAVVIGGTLLTGGRGYVVGSLLGVLVLGIIKTLISFDGTLSSYWIRIITGVLLLAFVIVQRFATRRRA